MKKAIKVFGVIAALAVIGFSMAGCGNDDPDTGDPNTGGNTIPAGLVGGWGVNSENGGDGTAMFEIKADGTGTFSGNDCTWSASGDRLTLTLAGQSGSVKYELSGGKLKLSDPQGQLTGMWQGILSLMQMGAPNGLDKIGGSNNGSHTHDFGGAWKRDTEQHWKECPDDGEKEQTAAHAFEWTQTKAPSTTEDGEESETCTVCGATAGTRTIPKGEYITGSTGITMVRIPAGTFQMGSPEDEPNRSTDETRHSVTLTQGFYMGRYQVTQEQYQAVMGTNPSNFKTGVTAGEVQEKRPVEMVSWYDALVFCNKLSVIEGLTPAYSISGSTDPDAWGSVPTGISSTWDAVTVVAGSTGYRLPTEAQWEYACRAGTTTAWYTGDSEDEALKAAAWYDANAENKTHEVGLKTPNAWGLYDMHGNVDEWCWDRYGAYASGEQTDPAGAVSGTDRVLRGGSWYYYGRLARSAYRGHNYPFNRDYYDVVGFRLARP